MTEWTGEKLMTIFKEKRVGRLEEYEVDQRIIHKTKNSYKNKWKANRTELGRGVRQGWCLSPAIFNFYIEVMLTNILVKKR